MPEVLSHFSEICLRRSDGSFRLASSFHAVLLRLLRSEAHAKSEAAEGRREDIKIKASG